MSKPIDAVAVENISKILGEYTTGPKITKMFSLLGFFDYDLQSLDCIIKVTTQKM